MKTINNKVTIAKSFSILLFFIFFVGLQNSLFAKGVCDSCTQGDAVGIPITSLSEDSNLNSDARAKLSERLISPLIPFEVIPLSPEMKTDFSGNRDGTMNFAKCLNPPQNMKIQVRNKRIYLGVQRMLYTSSKNLESIYVMDVNGDIYICDAKERGGGVFIHPSFLNGEPVAGAGMIRVEDGILKCITNSSGHYKPEAKFLWQVAARFRELGIDYNFHVGVVNPQTRMISPNNNYLYDLH